MAFQKVHLCLLMSAGLTHIALKITVLTICDEESFAALSLLSSITHVNLYHAAVEAQKYAILSTFDLNDRLAGFALLISWRGHQPFAVPELWRREWRDSDPSPHTTTDLYSLAASFR